MKVETFFKIINSDFYAGVPDSQLKGLCNYLMNKYGIDSNHHIIAANEGNYVAIAAGYHLATGKIPVVYMQNSGEGNVVNPIASLLNDEVYGIPMIFIIGWRGEPGIHDEPQHIYQGKITLTLLEDLGIDYRVIDNETEDNDVEFAMLKFRQQLKTGKCVAFVVRTKGLEYDGSIEYSNSYTMRREEIIHHILKISCNDPIVCTTGKASRELFELREKRGESHKFDFLTVGSMGHSSSIALGIALNKPDRHIWCIDGDGSLLMHMGAMAVIGAHAPKNLVHVVINNEAHETVGGMPTVMGKVDLGLVAKACGYTYVRSADNFYDLDQELKLAREQNGLCFIEVKCEIGARDNLGRPTTTAKENKEKFMEYLKG